MPIGSEPKAAEPDRVTTVPRQVPAGDRRANCEVCGASGSTPLHLGAPGGELGVPLCADHARVVAATVAATLARLRAQHADSHVLRGRRLRDGEALDVIRAWARQAGYPVSSGGSVSPRIIAAYRDALASA